MPRLAPLCLSLALCAPALGAPPDVLDKLQTGASARADAAVVLGEVSPPLEPRFCNLARMSSLEETMIEKLATPLLLSLALLAAPSLVRAQATAAQTDSLSTVELTESPGRLAILGGGPIGVEMAQATARLGVDVRLVEGLDRLLAREEPEASEVITSALERDGVDVLRCPGPFNFSELCNRGAAASDGVI